MIKGTCVICDFCETLMIYPPKLRKLRTDG